MASPSPEGRPKHDGASHGISFPSVHIYTPNHPKPFRPLSTSLSVVEPTWPPLNLMSCKTSNATSDICLDAVWKAHAKTPDPEDWLAGERGSLRAPNVKIVHTRRLLSSLLSPCFNIETVWLRQDQERFWSEEARRFLTMPVEMR